MTSLSDAATDEGSIPSLTEQCNQIKEIIDDTELKLGDLWYLLSFKWWDVWVEHVNYRADENFIPGAAPGEIDNTDLLDLSDRTRVRQGAQNGSDYTLVPKAAWKLFSQWYGGGPEIARQVVQLGTYSTTLVVDVFPVVIVFEKSNTGSEPLVKLFFSRQTTIQQVRDRICPRYYVPPYKSRLWIKGVVDDEEKLELLDSPNELKMSLEEHQILEYAEMVVETQDHRGQWRTNPKRSYSDSDDEDAEKELGELPPMQPTRSSNSSYTSYSSSSSASSSSWSSNRMFSSWGYRHTEGRPSAPGAVGLNNLGNTCFMNSALQCLGNTPELTDYFINDHYVREINRENPLGMKGMVAESYASLLKETWSNKYSVVSPSDFKSTIGKFRPQFSGFNQQDSQELVGFLLDGLHEDLNRRYEKPFTEAIESDGSPDEEVANEAWRRYQLRHDSKIVDLFCGQYKSRVQCPEPGCDRVSVTFDPMMYLSVPLPQKNTKALKIRLCHADPNLPPQLHVITVPKIANFGAVRQQLAAQSGVPAELLCINDVQNKRSWGIRDDYKSIYSLLDGETTYVYTVPPIAGTEAEQQAAAAAAAAGAETDPTATADSKGKAPMDSNIQYTYVYNALTGTHTRVPQKPAMHVRFQLLHRKAIRYSDGYVSRTFFHNPMILSIPVGEATNARVHHIIRSYINERILKAEHAVPLEPAPHRGESPDPGLDPAEQTAPAPLPFLILVGSQLQELPFNDSPFSVRDWVHDLVTLDWSDEGIALWDMAKADLVTHHDSVEQHRQQANSRQDGTKLRDCIELYSAEEQLGEQNTWYCNKCREHRQALKQLTLWKVPKYLVIHLKRFQYNSHWRDRIDDHVDFPIDGLDLRDFVVGPQHDTLPPYDLYGVSNHIGGMSGGHYTAYVRNPITNSWFSCNDSSVHPLGDVSRIVSSDAYLLFYKARDSSNQITLPAE